MFAGSFIPRSLIVATGCALTLSACDRGFADQHDESNTRVQQYVPGLAMQMKDIQYWTHKLGLSIEARNSDLVDFYHHELEEAAEDLIDSIEEYDGHPIAELTGTLLVPALEQLEETFEEGDWEQTESAFSAVIQSCNSCHGVTEHGHIRITEGYGNNPFNQRFEP